ncbi:MAG: sulfatase, partial [Candidatus Hodarchaeota archaeon]
MTRENVIWVFGDQHRAQALSCNGNEKLSTPNLDEMSMRGFNFYNAVAGYPLCCPFRGTLLTSKYPHECVPGHQYRLPVDMKTIAHVFNDAGYKTAYFGKWHLDGAKEFKGSVTKHVVPPERRGGFQVWMGYENNNKQWDTWVHGWDGEKEVQPYLLPDYETNELASLLINYLEKIKDEEEKTGEEKPFFAVLSVQPPHNPYWAPEEYMERHFDLDKLEPNEFQFRENVPHIKKVREMVARDLGGAYAMIENLDFNVGRVLDALEKCNLGSRTHVMFFSDHGDMHGSHGHFRKTTPYEESIRIPFIIGGSKSIVYEKAGDSLIDAMMNNVDIAPTTLGICGIEIPDEMDGIDYSHYVKGEGKKTDEPESAYIQSNIPTGHHDCIDAPWRGIVTRDGWKYVCFENMEWLMFDLNEDPYEMQNLAHYSAYKEKKKALNEKLRQWIDVTRDVFQLPDIEARYK